MIGEARQVGHVNRGKRWKESALTNSSDVRIYKQVFVFSVEAESNRNRSNLYQISFSDCH